MGKGIDMTPYEESLILIMKRINKTQGDSAPPVLYPHLTDKEDYKFKLQGKRVWNDINISIENKKGSTRSGIDSKGKPWEIKMKHSYGRIPRTEGNDGDNVDVIIGPDLNSDLVFIVHQTTPWMKGWDEDKCIIGAKTKKQAESIFKSMYNQGGFMGPIDTISVEVFKEQLKGSRKGKSIGSSKITDSITNMALGILIEMEHTDDIKEAAKIAGDHLGEDKNYYLDPSHPFIEEAHEEIMKLRPGMMDSKFDELVKKIMKEQGYSKERASRIAYSVGVKKYGKAGMAKKSAAGRDADPLAEVILTPLIKKLMGKLGFKKMRWIGRGWFVSITSSQYGKFLTMIPLLKGFDSQLKKMGYEIRINPFGFFIEPMRNGNAPS